MWEVWLKGLCDVFLLVVLTHALFISLNALSGWIFLFIDFLFLRLSRCVVSSPEVSGSRSSRTLWRLVRPPTTTMRRSPGSWRGRTGSCKRSSRRWTHYIQKPIIHMVIIEHTHVQTLQILTFKKVEQENICILLKKKKRRRRNLDCLSKGLFIYLYIS